MENQPVAIVTAASRGIGAGCAQHLAKRGYALVLMGRSADVESLAKELGAESVRGDVTNPDDLKKLVEHAMARFGRVDAVVNNTGHAAKGELLGLGDDDWHRGLDILLLNVVRMAKLVTPPMLERKRGAIVNISSFAAAEPGLRFPVSATLRAALGNFTKLYSQRYAGSGLRMNNVLPGWVDTYNVDEASLQSIPAKRAGTPEDVAKAVGYLLSDEASYITGQSLLVDGGLVRAA
jgi:NAD(P)-dependent dehydrogenase (short-subunit alcohol dehydrogenase family)